MTGKEHTNATGARKGARPQSRPKQPAASPQAPAVQPAAGPSHAAEGSEPRPEGAGPYRLEIPVVIGYETGRDPEAQPGHRAKAEAAVHGLQVCESLFWALQQLGRLAVADAWVYRESDLYEALDNLGELGQAVASGASEQVQRLEQAAERLHAGRE